MASVTAQLQLLQQLEGQLRKLAKENSFSEPAVRDVRKQLRAAAESVALKNYAVSEEKGIELKLWHQCFHKPVQEVRRRLAEAKGRGEKGKELHSKLNKAFGALLLDGIAFYKVFAAKLQRVYGDVGYSLSTRDQGTFKQHLQGIQPAADKVDVSQSVARCLICLGDLTRYHVQALGEAPKDWSTADEFYSHATRIFPQGGNAFNQRAVLAGYEGRHLAAVYHYFRSLGVAAPFTVARENLRQLFEQLRRQQRKLPSADEGRPPRSLHGWKLPELVAAVELRFLHLQGLLFTQIDFDTFGQVIRAALSELDDLLSRGAVVEGPPGHGSARSDLSLLQLVSITIFHPADPPDPQTLSAQEAAKAKAVRAAALDQVFVLTGRLARALAVVGAGSPLGIASSPLLPALSVLLQWLQSHPHQLRDPEEQRIGTRSYLVKALAEFAVAAAASCEKAGVRPLAPRPGHKGWPALPEDRELRGYAPLAAFQDSIDFSRPAEPEAGERLSRVAGMLLGIAADMSAADLETTAGCPGARKAVAAFTGQVARSLQPALQLEGDEAPGELEVIVFQPAGVLPELGNSPSMPPSEPLPAASQALVMPATAHEAPAAMQATEDMQVDEPAKITEAPRRDWDPFGGLLPTIPMSPAATPEPGEARQPSPLPAQLSQEFPSRPSTRPGSPPQQLPPNGAQAMAPGFPRGGAFDAAAAWSRPSNMAVAADTPAFPDPWIGLGEGAQAGSAAGWTPVPTAKPENYAGFLPQGPAPWSIPMHSLDGEVYGTANGIPAGVTPAGNTLQGSPWGPLEATPGVQLNQGAPPGTATQQRPAPADLGLLHHLFGGSRAPGGPSDPWAWQNTAPSVGFGDQNGMPGQLAFLPAASAVQPPMQGATPEPAPPRWDAQLGDTSWLDAFEAQQKQLASARLAAAGRGMR